MNVDHYTDASLLGAGQTKPTGHEFVFHVGAYSLGTAGRSCEIGVWRPRSTRRRRPRMWSRRESLKLLWRLCDRAVAAGSSR
jgi:hypothetical protein